MSSTQKEFLTSREAAELLGVAVSTVQLWTESDLLRAWKTGGGHRRIARNSVEAMLQQQRAIFETPKSDDKLTVVVVEDKWQQRKLYQQQLAARDLPIQLIMASNGFEGLIQIGRYLPEVIITDLLMPDMDGFQMLRALKTLPELANCLHISISALTDQQIKLKGGLPDGTMCFTKPIPFDDLEAVLRTQIAQISQTGRPVGTQ